MIWPGGETSAGCFIILDILNCSETSAMIWAGGVTGAGASQIAFMFKFGVFLGNVTYTVLLSAVQI